MRLLKAERESLRETFYSGRHESGLEVLVNPKKGFSKTIAILATRFGSVDNRFANGSGEVCLPDGLAHFLEHELLTKKTGDISERFARSGAHANAGTGFTSTSFYFSCTRALNANLSLLLELVFKPYFSEEHIRKEQSVIRQEIRMYEDSPDWRLYTNLLESLYHRHPIRVDIAGTEESIEKIDAHNLDHAYRTFYHPSNMILILVGEVDPDKISKQVDRCLARLDFAAAPDIRRVPAREPKGIVRREVTEHHPVSQPKILIGYKDPTPPIGGRELLEREVRMNMLLQLMFGGSAHLYQEFYESGLIDDSFSASYSADGGTGFTVVGGDTDSPDELRGALRSALRRHRRTGLDESAFRRVRQRLMGKFFFGFNSPESTASTLLGFWNKGSDVWDYPEVVRSTELGDLEQALEERLQSRYSATSQVLPDGTANGSAPQ